MGECGIFRSDAREGHDGARDGKAAGAGDGVVVLAERNIGSGRTRSKEIRTPPHEAFDTCLDAANACEDEGGRRTCLALRDIVALGAKATEHHKAPRAA